MRRVKVLALGVVVILFSSVIVFAQGTEEKKEPIPEEKTQEKQMEKDRMGGMMMNMMGMMQKQMVATSDGGIIVLAGNRLLKYDKDLNLVREVELKAGGELKMDVGSIQDMMQMMKEKYGKHKEVKAGESQDK